MTRISIDLFGDYIASAKTELENFGYNQDNKSQREILVTFLNWKHRQVPPAQRTILKAPGFQCPAEVKDGLQHVENLIRTGGDLTPHLSTGLDNPDYDDDLLNHWGIYHLHLKTEPHPTKPGYAARSGPLLLCRFDDHNAYFLGIYHHRPAPWSKQELIRIIHDNWPKSIEGFRIKNAIRLANNVTDEDVKTLRKKNGNAMIDLGGGYIYVPPGGGVSTSGKSTQLIILGDIIEKQLKSFSNQLANNPEEVRQGFADNGHTLPTPAVFRLHIDDNGRIYAVETSTDAAIEGGELGNPGS